MINRNSIKTVFAALCFSITAIGAATYTPVAEFQGTIPGTNTGVTNGFGSAVKLNGDWAFVSSPLATPHGKTAGGVVYAYKRDNHGNYDTANPQIIDFPGPSHHLGLLKAESQRDWLFLSCIGTPVQDNGQALGDFKGALLVYRLICDQWTHVQTIDSNTVPALEDLVRISDGAINVLNPPYANQQGASFGMTFGVDVDSGLLIVSAGNQTNDSVNSVNQGRAYAFRLIQGQWVYQQTLSNPDGITANDGFGAQIAVNGNLALISNGLIFQGPRVGKSTVYVYKLQNNCCWELVQRVQGQQTADSYVALQFLLIPGYTANVGDTFGSAIALDDRWAVIGAAYENLGSTIGKGAVYFYKVNPFLPQPLTFVQKFVANDVNPLAQVFSLTNVAIDGNIAVVSNVCATGPAPDLVPFVGGANVYVLQNGPLGNLPGNVWKFDKTLYDPQGSTGANVQGLFGGGVDVKGNQIFIGGGAQGIASVFLQGNPPVVGQTPPFSELRTAVIYKQSSP